MTVKTKILVCDIVSSVLVLASVIVAFIGSVLFNLSIMLFTFVLLLPAIFILKIGDYLREKNIKT